MTQPQAEFVDLYRAGLKTAADVMKASLQNAERLQNQQLVVIRSALDQQSKALSELSSARTIDDLMAVQTRMAGAQLERAMGFWSELCQTQMTQAQGWFNQVGAAQASVAATIRAAQPRTEQRGEQQHQHHQRGEQHQQRKSA